MLITIERSLISQYISQAITDSSRVQNYTKGAKTLFQRVRGAGAAANKKICRRLNVFIYFYKIGLKVVLLQTF